MANIETGVKSYIKTIGIVENSFPVDFRGNEYLCCNYCKFYGRSYGTCKLTDEIILMADKFVGHNCPLKVKEE